MQFQLTRWPRNNLLTGLAQEPPASVDRPKILPLPQNPGIPTTIQTIGVNVTTIAYLRVLIIGIGTTIILMVVETQGIAGAFLLIGINERNVLNLPARSE